MKTELPVPKGYESKPSDYFQWSRPEMQALVPGGCRRILDVGCGVGSFGESLKQIRNVEVWGVEPVGAAAEVAKQKLDHVIHGLFGPDLGLPARTFDCVIFNDVLEHMLAPEEALRHARTLLAPDGIVLASIPNIRSLPTFWQLLAHARWDYQDSGVLDKTHLRFFTKSSIVEMFRREAYSVISIRGINAKIGAPHVRSSLWRAYRIVNAAFFGRFDDMKYLQFAVVAKPIADGVNPNVPS